MKRLNLLMVINGKIVRGGVVSALDSGIGRFAFEHWLGQCVVFLD